LFSLLLFPAKNKYASRELVFFFRPWLTRAGSQVTQPLQRRLLLGLLPRGRTACGGWLRGWLRASVRSGVSRAAAHFLGPRGGGAGDAVLALGKDDSDVRLGRRERARVGRGGGEADVAASWASRLRAGGRDQQRLAGRMALRLVRSQRGGVGRADGRRARATARAGRTRGGAVGARASSCRPTRRPSPASRWMRAPRGCWPAGWITW
jgi:hypothetical protein